MTEAVKAKVDRDRDLQDFFEKLLELFISAQKICTKAPIFMSGGHQPGQDAHPIIVVLPPKLYLVAFIK